MPRRPKQRGFDIRDEPADCYDATGQFPHLSAAGRNEPASAPTAPAEAVEDADAGTGAARSSEAHGPTARPRWVATAALVAVALLALFLITRPQQRGPAEPAPRRPAPAAVAPAPAPPVAAVTSAALPRSKRQQLSRSKPTRPRQRRRSVRRRPAAPPAAAAPATVRRPVAPVRRPAAEPAGGEFILGAR